MPLTTRPRGIPASCPVWTVVGGLAIDGEVIVGGVVNANTWTFEHDEQAAATASGGGSSVMAQYEINVGRPNQLFGTGWGAGAWGEGTWGTARGSSGIVLPARTWSMDNWGEDLLFMHNDQGALYTWDATAGPTVRATLVASAPQGEFMFVSGKDRHVIILGASGDDLAVQWCNQGDFTDWHFGIDSTADVRRLLKGTRFKAFLSTRGGTLLWTDTFLHLLQFTASGDYNFAIADLGDAQICGPFACTDVNGRAYWMAPTGFYKYSGEIIQIDCGIQQTIFDDYDYSQEVKVVAAPNRQWNSIRFHYCSVIGGTSEIDRYADYNHVEESWIPGKSDGGMQCLAWIDRGIFNVPISINVGWRLVLPRGRERMQMGRRCFALSRAAILIWGMASM